MAYYLQSLTNPKVRFRIISRDPATGMTKMQGMTSEFEEVVNKDTMEKYKYKIVKEEENADQV
jgi:hypothetical protein